MIDIGIGWIELREDSTISAYDRAVKVLSYCMMDRDKLVEAFSTSLPFMKDEGMCYVVDALMDTLPSYIRQRVLLNLAASLIEQGRPLPKKLASICAAYLRGDLQLVSSGKNKTVLRDSALAQAVHEVSYAHNINPTRNSETKVNKSKSACDVVFEAYNNFYKPCIGFDVVVRAWKRRQNLL